MSIVLPLAPAQYSQADETRLRAILEQVLVRLLEEDPSVSLPVYADATRPAAGVPGRVIFNSDDGKINVDDGTNWTLPDGTTT